MKRQRQIIGWKCLWVLSLAVSIVLLAGSALAQGPGRGMRLSPEEAKGAWALEAKHVASKQELSEEATTKLSKAYMDARTSFAAEMGKKRDEMRLQGGDRASAMSAYRKAYEELRAAEREKLSAALAEFLTEEQTKKAMDQLTGFSDSLDRMVHVLSGFKLEDKQGKALDLVFAYSREQAKMWAENRDQQQDFGEVRERMMTLKTKLDTNLGDILSKEQMEKWNEATSYRGRGYGGGRRNAEENDSASSDSPE